MEKWSYVLLRLPHEVKDLFREWLVEHESTKANHVMQRIRDCRGGEEYVAEFGTRMRGTGIFADLLSQRFSIASQRLGFQSPPNLDTSCFRAPHQVKDQIEMFE